MPPATGSSAITLHEIVDSDSDIEILEPDQDIQVLSLSPEQKKRQKLQDLFKKVFPLVHRACSSLPYQERFKVYLCHPIFLLSSLISVIRQALEAYLGKAPAVTDPHECAITLIQKIKKNRKEDENWELELECLAYLKKLVQCPSCRRDAKPLAISWMRPLPKAEQAAKNKRRRERERHRRLAEDIPLPTPIPPSFGERYRQRRCQMCASEGPT
ncbi:hypothetical protein B0H14DRAFT_2642305 [Mycena olivaceomarginata]|nr:hypothetical protein B0H14DRAFT_2642305 [Mycena olivaceomarginata]